MPRWMGRLIKNQILQAIVHDIGTPPSFLLLFLCHAFSSGWLFLAHMYIHYTLLGIFTILVIVYNKLRILSMQPTSRLEVLYTKSPQVPVPSDPLIFWLTYRRSTPILLSLGGTPLFTAGGMPSLSRYS